ncbi:MAG: hypothetical protein HC944_06545 [Nanoarchaeota archaeon]|nr:hypothetical protein [Nanoarchaeota archaeon]
MQNKRLVIVGVIVGIASIFSVSMLYPDSVLQAFGGETLNSADSASSMQVRIIPGGTDNEFIYNTFSRIGFVAGEANFLLESVPSKDKNSFYKMVKASLEDKFSINKKNQLDVLIDIFSGDGEVIETLVYKQCRVTQYFVHVVDSKGTILFLKDEGTVEIREVTKFECVSFTIDLTTVSKGFEFFDPSFNITDSHKFEDLTTDPYFSRPPATPVEGELFYNSNTNTLQKFVNGTWIDISGKGGPPTPRK